ncbi:hypothetical protein B0H13DRAFT_2504882 [Mycena leptocephala]|nr:hypothetical protein B0H13DRAFT_2504882 [Mycena leptocephala]
MHNEVVDRYGPRQQRKRRAQAADENVYALQRAQAENKSAGDEIRRQLKQARAQAKSSSSGRAYVSWPRKKNMNKQVAARLSSTPENGAAVTVSGQPETEIHCTTSSSVAETSATIVAAATSEQVRQLLFIALRTFIFFYSRPSRETHMFRGHGGSKTHSPNTHHWDHINFKTGDCSCVELRPRENVRKLRRPPTCLWITQGRDFLYPVMLVPVGYLSKLSFNAHCLDKNHVTSARGAVKRQALNERLCDLPSMHLSVLHYLHAAPLLRRHLRSP